MAAVANLLLSISCLTTAVAKDYVAYVDDAYITPLRHAAKTNWTFLSPTQKPSQAELATVDFYVPSYSVPEIIPQLTNCRVYQLAYTGYDKVNFSSIPANWAVANVHQAGAPIGEYVLRNMLEWNIRQNTAEEAFRRCTWNVQAPGNECSNEFGMHKEIHGQTLGIVGYGHIGNAIATRAAAFGVKVIAVDVEAQDPAPAPLSWLGSDSELPKLLKESDFVVVAVPLLPSTVGMVNASNIKYMSNTSVLINIARGPIVEETALYDALVGNQIGGAVLDVWWHAWEWRNTGEVGPTSWPAEHDFSKLANVVMTPHISAMTQQSRLDAIVQIAANLDHLQRGEPLDNVVRNATALAAVVYFS